MAVVGPAVDVLAVNSLKSLKNTVKFSPASQPHNISIVSEQELRGLSESQLAQLPTEIDPRYVFAAGVGGEPSAGVFFVVVVWTAGQRLRKSLNLPYRHFYIALSEADDHDMDKGIDSLLPGQFPDSPSADFLDHLAFTLHLFSQFEREQPFCIDLITALPNSHRGFMRLADAARCAGQHKLAMLSYASAFQRTDETKAQDYCVKKLADCSKYTEWGALFLESELSQIPAAIASMLLEPWSEGLRSVIEGLDIVPSLCLEPRERLLTSATVGTLPNYRLPRNFRWLVPFCIAVMSTPK